MKLLRPTLQGRTRSDHGISSLWGPRDIGFHHGQDYYWLLGDPVNSRACYGVASGTVNESFWSNSMGWCLGVEISPDLHVRYCHMASIAVSMGQTLDHNSYVGHMGATGTEARGEVHLHFEVWVRSSSGWNRVDPEPYFQADLIPSGESTPFVTHQSKRKNTMLYYKIGTTPFLFALAGDSPGTPANWLETTDQGLSNAWLAQIVGPNVQMNTIGLNEETWEMYKRAYTAPLSVAGTTSSGAPADLAPVLAAIDKVPADVRDEFAKNPLK